MADLSAARITGHPIVDAVAQIPIYGKVSENWYRTIRTAAGNIDHTAIALLSYFVGWYQPMVDSNGYTGETKYRKRFKEYYFRTSYQALSDIFGDGEKSKKTIQRSMRLLESLGIIKRHLLSQTINGREYHNILAVEIIPAGLLAASFPKNQSAANVRRPYAGEDLGLFDILGTDEQEKDLEAAGQPMWTLVSTWAEQPIVEKSDSSPQSLHISEEAIPKNYEGNMESAGQSMWTPVSTWIEQPIVEKSDSSPQSLHISEDTDSASTCNSLKNSRSGPLDTGVHTSGHQCPDITNTQANTHISLLASFYDAEAMDLVEKSESKQANDEKEFEEFCRMFPGKIDPAHLPDTLLAWRRALADGFTTEEIKGSYLCARKKYLEDPSNNWKPYDFPLYWLVATDGLETWADTYRRQVADEEFRAKYALDIPKVYFAFKGTAEGYALWAAKSSVEELSEPTFFLSKDSLANLDALFAGYVEKVFEHHPHAFEANPMFYAIFSMGEVELVDTADFIREDTSWLAAAT